MPEALLEEVDISIDFRALGGVAGVGFVKKRPGEEVHDVLAVDVGERRVVEPLLDVCFWVGDEGEGAVEQRGAGGAGGRRGVDGGLGGVRGAERGGGRRVRLGVGGGAVWR